MTSLLCPLCSQPRFDTLESLRVSLIQVATQNIACPICQEVLLGLDKLTIHLFGHTINDNSCEGESLLPNHDSNGPETEKLKDFNKNLEAQENGNFNHEVGLPHFLFCEESRNKEIFKQTPQQSLETVVDECSHHGEFFNPHCTQNKVFKVEDNQQTFNNVAADKVGANDLNQSCTVNMEDLSFLTSWDNSVNMKLKTTGEADLKAEPSPETGQLLDKMSYREYRTDEHVPLINTDSNDSDKNTEQREENTELSEYMSDLLNKKLPILNFIFYDDNQESGPQAEPLPEVPKEEPTQPVNHSELKCGFCELVFHNQLILSMHQELVHSKLLAKFVLTAKHVEPEPTSKQTNVTSPAADTTVVTQLESDESKNTRKGTRFPCHLCRKSFKMKGSLMLHYRVAHFGLNIPVPEMFQLLSPSSPTEERNFHCSSCPKSFKKEQHLSQHIKTHEGKQWHCETCNKHFTTKYFLKKHQRLHTGEMPYSCPTCGKTFTFQQSYHKHLLYHSDDKPHECLECGRSFKELSTLHNHQRIHSGEKPFTCEICGKCFRQRVSYIVHQRIHTGVLPYQCTACNKKFRYKVSQKSHKCTAQPPGVVIRQPGDLIQRILEQRNALLQAVTYQ